MSALEILQQMDYQHKRRRYGSVPVMAIPKTTFKDSSANELTKAIQAFLKLKGHMTWRQSSEGRYRPGKEITDVLGHVRQMKGQWLPGQSNGAADVCAIVAGVFCAIEVKIKKDVQSKVQMQYQQQVEGSGGKYFIARDFESFYKWYNNLTI